MKSNAYIALAVSAMVAASAAMGASSTDKALSDARTTGAVLAAEIKDAELECSGNVSLLQLHDAVTMALDENGFRDTDTSEWRAAMASALKQHARFISMTKSQQAEFCANLVANGFIK